jgi:hypothetical protein
MNNKLKYLIICCLFAAACSNADEKTETPATPQQQELVQPQTPKDTVADTTNANTQNLSQDVSGMVVEGSGIEPVNPAIEVIDFDTVANLVVNDYEGILTATEIKHIEKLISDNPVSKQNDIRVVTIADFKPYENIAQFASQLGEKWNVGGDNKKGVLLVFSSKRQQVRIAVREGLKETLTEQECANIINNYMVPELSKNHLFFGLKYGAARIIELLEKTGV